MSKIGKIYLRKTREELGRFPNWPVNQKIQIGQIGYYDGRKACFHWETDLKFLGIQVPESAPDQLMSELYTSNDSVSVEFNTDQATGQSEAFLGFSKKYSVVTQGYGMAYKSIELGQLKDRLLQEIGRGMKWDYDYVIITELWTAEGFTTLISNAKSGSSKVSAGSLLRQKPFNIADFNLDLKVCGCNGMAYQGIAEKNVQPYFQIHRLTKDNQLKRYGRDTGFWGY
jgi:hypothetical protein